MLRKASQARLFNERKSDVKLSNGEYVAEYRVVKIMTNLSHLELFQRPHFVEFINKCRDNNCNISQSTVSIGAILGLNDANGRIYEDARQVALSAVVGIDSAMRLENPFKASIASRLVSKL
jgi:hypothetical protein